MRRLLLLFAVAILASCRNNASDASDVSSTSSPSYDGVIGFTASITPNTRIDTFASSDAILVAAYEAGAIYGDQAIYTYDGASFMNADGIIRTSEDQLLSYIAVYPSTVSNFGMTFDFTVDTDQSSNLDNSDLLVATLAATASTMPELSFTHALTSLIISFDGDDLEDGTLVVNAIPGTTIEISGTSYTATAIGTAIELTASGSGTEYTIIFAPQTIAEGAAFATYTIAGKTPYTWTTKNDLTFESGCRYSYTWTIESSSADDLTSNDTYNGTVALIGDINGWEYQDIED